VHSLGEKIEETTGYKLTAEEPKKEDEFVKFVDPIAKPQELEAIKSTLKPTETIDHSIPVIDRNVHIKENHHKQLLEELGHQTLLNHVETTHDASAPIIDKDIHIKEAPQKQILDEIARKDHDLKHVEMTHDASAPVIPKDVHIVIKKKLVE